MNHLCFAFSFILVACSPLIAQTSAPKQKNENTRASNAAALDPEIQQRRSVALSALQSLAIEARSYRDEPLRVRVQARIADALWDQDQDAARALFRRAWEAAEAL